MWAGAEALGFEPRWRLPTPSGFQDRRNRPLCQTSISTRTGAPSIWRAAISCHGAGGGIRTLTDDVQLILSQWRLPIPPRPHCVNHHTTLSRSNQQNHIGTDLRRTYARRTMLRNAGAQSERTGATLALLRPVEAAHGTPPHRCRDRVLTGSFHQTFRKLEFNQTHFSVLRYLATRTCFSPYIRRSRRLHRSLCCSTSLRDARVTSASEAGSFPHRGRVLPKGRGQCVSSYVSFLHAMRFDVSPFVTVRHRIVRRRDFEASLSSSAPHGSWRDVDPSAPRCDDMILLIGPRERSMTVRSDADGGLPASRRLLLIWRFVWESNPSLAMDSRVS